MADHHLTPLCTCQLRSVWCRQRYFSRLLIKVMKRDSPAALLRSAYFSPNTVPASCDASCWTAWHAFHLEGPCSMSKLWKRNAHTSSSRFLVDDSRAQDATRAATCPARPSGEAPVLSHPSILVGSKNADMTSWCSSLLGLQVRAKLSSSACCETMAKES